MPDFKNERERIEMTCRSEEGKRLQVIKLSSMICELHATDSCKIEKDVNTPSDK